MARNEQDREDILREATALVERVEIELPGHDEHVIAGFRRDGSASVFIGPDPVFQFNAGGELRRAYVAGRLIKAEKGRLVSLQRRRTAKEVQLLRTPLDDAAIADLLNIAAEHLQVLSDHLRQASFTVHGQVPATADIVDRVRSWLAGLPAPIKIAARPHLGTSKPRPPRDDNRG